MSAKLRPHADARRNLPSVDQLLREEGLRDLILRHGRGSVLAAARAALAERRLDLARGQEAQAAPWPQAIEERIAARGVASLRSVINATGVVIHTNLGRAPLSAAAAEQVGRLAASYSNIELDLASGERGDRELHAASRLTRLLAAEAALLVNNNAAAVLLITQALAAGREVLMSRGELVEIGGSFRIPDILRASGAVLREVGTTNRTRIEDYRAALTPATGLILKVHPSNFQILGFTESAALDELVALARQAEVPLVEDLGSGHLGLPAEILAGEPTAVASLRAGVDLACFSGDKLLGGPQAGVIVGRRALVERLRIHPLYRALRVGKLILAAMDATLAEHESGRAMSAVPVAHMLALTVEDLRPRVLAMVERLRARESDLTVEVRTDVSRVGGGAAPMREIPTLVIVVRSSRLSAENLALSLRMDDPPVVGRVHDDHLLIDLRTVRPEEDAQVVAAFARIVPIQ
ncbi:MAG: L-seryl-tRNA(Sec) selenium transferase [Vicinamibacteria bacterium]|jgi:L-seryl-tRNA(Ser) seleniumtransferase|nr:L-seryl-tRNA(Sec) selenium transferase [Vicinamibacteria bacterium]